MEREDTRTRTKESQNKIATETQKQFILSVRLAGWCALLDPQSKQCTNTGKKLCCLLI